MTSATEHYRALLDEDVFDTESLTILVVAGATREQVAGALGVDLSADPSEDEVPDEEDEDVDSSAYAIAEVAGGVVAVEHTGYADPSLDALRQITRGGGSAAVVRSNIQAHFRFGSARDGEIVLDDDEILYLDDPSRVPPELRALFDTIWTDPDAGDEDGAGGGGPDDDFATALAMAEVVTGLRVSADDLRTVADSGYRTAPSLTYVRDDDY